MCYGGYKTEDSLRAPPKYYSVRIIGGETIRVERIRLVFFFNNYYYIIVFFSFFFFFYKYKDNTICIIINNEGKWRHCGMYPSTISLFDHSWHVLPSILSVGVRKRWLYNRTALQNGFHIRSVLGLRVLKNTLDIIIIVL